MSATTQHRPSYADQPGWRRIQDALPAHLHHEGLVIDPGDPQTVPAEEWLLVRDAQLHVDRYEPVGSRSGATLVLVHGGDANGRMLAPYALMAAGAGHRAVAFDLPGYGLTQVGDKSRLVYEDWILATVAVLRAQADRGPVVVFGTGAGGLLAYEAAARTGAAAALIATHLLDWRKPAVLRSTARVAATARLAVPAIRGLQGLINPLPVPLRWVGDTRQVANEPALVDAIADDPLSGHNWMPGRFLRTMLLSNPALEPEAFAACPVVLAHPAADRWTPLPTSLPFFDRLEVARAELVVLEGCGHLPVERPGVDQLRDAIVTTLQTASDPPAPAEESTR